MYIHIYIRSLHFILIILYNIYWLKYDNCITILFQHPAPLPDTPSYTMTPGWKLPPPAPSLKISKVSNGIL